MNFTSVRYVNLEETIVLAITTDGLYVSGSTTEGDTQFLESLQKWVEEGNVITPYVPPVEAE